MRRSQFLATPLLLTPLMLTQTKEGTLTDLEHRDAAVTALKATTISYPDWVRRRDRGQYTAAQLAATQWQIAFDQLAAIGTNVDPVPPPPTGGQVDGIGIVRYGGSLAGTSHLDAYDVVIGDWADQALLAKQPGMSFAYRNLGPPGSSPINLSNPAAFVTECKNAVSSNPGLDGIFIDNCAEKDQATQLPFIKAALPPLKQAGIKLMLNAVATNPGQDDGSGDARWYAAVGPYATHLMSELWMQGRGGPELYRLRHRGSAHYSDYWDEWLKVPKAAHDTGCAFVGMTYGSLSNGIYGRASLLLVAQAGDVFCWNPDNVPEGTDPYNTAWMKNMGDPVDQSASGTNPVTRRFQNGVASVDPVNATASLT